MKEHMSECDLTEFVPRFLLRKAPVRSVIALASGSFSGGKKNMISNICMSNWNIFCQPNLLTQHPNFSNISSTPNYRLNAGLSVTFDVMNMPKNRESYSFLYVLNGHR